MKAILGDINLLDEKVTPVTIRKIPKPQRTEQ
jgi:hypothetical protein